MYKKRFVLAAVVSSTLIGILGMVVLGDQRMGRVGTRRRARRERGLSGDSLGRFFLLRVAPRDDGLDRQRLLGAVLRRCKQQRPVSKLPRSEWLGRSGADGRERRVTVPRRMRDEPNSGAKLTALPDKPTGHDHGPSSSSSQFSTLSTASRKKKSPHMTDSST